MMTIFGSFLTTFEPQFFLGSVVSLQAPSIVQFGETFVIMFQISRICVKPEANVWIESGFSVHQIPAEILPWTSYQRFVSGSGRTFSGYLQSQSLGKS